jgi:rubrerythrin
MTPAKALQIAIDGETYEYTEMYPGFRAAYYQPEHTRVRWQNPVV